MVDSIKITALQDIGANIAYTTLVPVVNMAGTPTTQKSNLQNLGNLILNGAGGSYFPRAAQANIALSVANAAQPNITSVGTLTSLTVTGNIAAGNINGGNIVVANYYYGDGRFLTNVGSNYSNSNVANYLPTYTGNVGANWLIADYVSGNAYPLTYIPGGNVVGAVANAGYATTAGAANTANTANTANSAITATSATTAGTVTTASQPNITSIGTLTGLNVSGNATVSGNLTVDGNLVYVNVETLSVKDPIIELQTGPNGTPPVANSGKDVGTALNYYDTQARVAFMGWDVSNAEFGMASQASLSNEVVTFNQYGNLRVGNIIGNGQALTGINGANVTGIVPQANVAEYVNVQVANSNITTYSLALVDWIAGNHRIETELNTLKFNANTHTLSTINVNADIITANYFSGNGSNLTGIAGANVTGTVANATYATSAGSATTAGAVTTNAQPNITSVGTLSNLTVTGNVSANYFVGVATGVAVEAVNNNYSYHMAFVTGAGDTTLHMDDDDNLQYNPADGTMTVTRVDSGYLAVNQSVISNLNPLANVTQDLGNTTNRWKDIWLANSTIHMGDATISANGNSIVVDSITVTDGNVGTIGNVASLNLDGSNSNVLYGNGVFAPASGGGGNTGNVTFDNVTVQGVNGLNLSAGSDFTANLAYLQVRAGDVASHIHLDTGNNQAYDLIVGDDQNYVQVSSTGNILLSAYDSNTSQYTWTLDYNGNLILAGGNSVIQSIANSSLDPLNPNVSTMALTPDANYSSQALVLDPTAPGHIHLRSPGANIDEPYANLFLGGENTSFEVGAFYGATPNAYIHSGGNTWTFASDGNLIFPRDANINTDPYLRINGGANPTIISEDTSLAGPANLAIVSDYLTLQGYSESITIRNNDGTFSGSPNLSLSLNAYDDGDSPVVQMINWNSNSGFPTTIVSSEPDQVALTTNVSSPSPYSWTFDNAGTLTVPGNLVATAASPAPVISGFSSVSALQFTNGNSNVTINANSNLWTFDSTGNLIVPGTSGGVIKTVANGAISIAAIDNGSDNPAQVISFNANGTPTTALSAYASEATIQANINGDIKTWAFNNAGNLVLPGNTLAINYANGTAAFGNIVSVNKDGNASNVLLGNGVFSSLPSPTSIVNGNSNVAVAANGNVTVGVAGTANVITATSTGANVTGTLNATGNVTAQGTGSNIIRRAFGLVASDVGVTLDDLTVTVSSATSQLTLSTSGSWQGTGWTETFAGGGTPTVNNWVNLPLNPGFNNASGAMNSQGNGCRCVISDQTPTAKVYQITVVRSGTSGAQWNISIERLV